MSRKLVLLGLLSLILAPGAALSLGLGEIRLGSYLNQPMNAEIALTLASRGELDTLRVELAPAEAFARYGLERGAFLDDLRFQVQSTGATSAVVSVTSSRPITEPFVTFLVEARWSGGRVLREYTVLLDPPTFLPAPEAAPAPPPAVDAPRPAPVERPGEDAAPVMTPAPVVTPAPAPATFEAGADFGPVQRNDTLWAIAQRVRPDAGLTTNQVMVALFRANPGAFDGNINRLRAGAILRVPARAEMAAASSAEATAEVRRQNEAWRGPAAPVERRLELAPPTEAPRPAAPAADPVRDPAAASPQVLEAVEQLRGELAETRRLMEVKDAEIAALQARLAELESEGVPVPPPVTGEPAPAETTAPVAEPVAEPAPEPAPAPEVVTPAPTPAPVAPPPSLLDRVLALLGSMWLWLALAAALIVAAVAVFLRKRRDEGRSIEDELAETGSWAALPETGKPKAAAAGGAAAIVPRARPENPDAILVEEAAPPAARAAPEAAPRPVPMPVPPAPAPEAAPEAGGDEAYRYPFEDTIAGETGINLDQADPLAEADFHMAYGLYDQAAEIIKKAVEREPDRYDLRRKLIDICFVWGNADEFLKQAKALRELGGEGQATDWAKVSIMGRQICPGEPMFAAGTAAAVDVDLAATQGDISGAEDSLSTSGQWLDFDVGESNEPVLDTLGDTSEQPAPGGRRTIDQTAELDLEELGIEFDLGESGEHALKDLGALADEEEFTGTTRLTDPPRFGPAEGAAAGGEDDVLDDQDEDGNTLLMDVSTAPGSDPTREGERLDLSGDDPTLSGIKRIDTDSLVDDTLMGEAPVPDDDDPTLTGLGALPAEGPETDETREAPYSRPDSSPTMESGALDDELDLDLDDLTQAMEFELADQGEQASKDDDATMMAPALEPGERRSFGASSFEEGDTREMAPPEINEIGTKLDLARAYIDMGDAEGARSILGEVVEEGDEAQQEEARQLLESLD
jgi:pilus assembly protein FimV